MAMRLGCCLGFEGTDEDLARIEVLAAVGFEYLEPPVSCLHVQGDPEAYYAVRRALRRAALRPEAFNCFIPGDLKLVGDQVDWPRVEKHVALALDRMEELGASVVVFGSGAARQVPEGYPPEDALAQLRYFLNMAADYAGDLTVAVEPLGPAQTNMLNTVAEAAQLVREVGRCEVRILADSVHMDAAAEPWGVIVEERDLLAHVHCCDRGHVVPGRGGADLAGFFSALAAAGYDGRVSLQCPLPDLESDAREALEHMRQLVLAAARA